MVTLIDLQSDRKQQGIWEKKHLSGVLCVQNIPQISSLPFLTEKCCKMKTRNFKWAEDNTVTAKRYILMATYDNMCPFQCVLYFLGYVGTIFIKEHHKGCQDIQTRMEAPGVSTPSRVEIQKILFCVAGGNLQVKAVYKKIKKQLWISDGKLIRVIALAIASTTVCGRRKNRHWMGWLRKTTAVGDNIVKTVKNNKIT